MEQRTLFPEKRDEGMSLMRKTQEDEFTWANVSVQALARPSCEEAGRSRAVRWKNTPTEPHRCPARDHSQHLWRRGTTWGTKLGLSLAEIR